MADSAAKLRVPPHSVDAEMAVLGSVLLDPNTIDDVIHIVKSEHFYRPAHQIIFEVMVEMRNTGKEIDALSLKEHLTTSNQIERTGGAAYLFDLTSAVPTSHNFKRYAEIVREKAIFRQLINMGVMVTAIGYDADCAAEEAVSETVSMALGLSASHQSSAIPIGTVMKDLVALLKLGKQDFIAPPELPWVHIKSKELVVVAAASSVGKTAISVNWADEWSKETRVAYFEYEMAEVDLAARIACKYAGVTVEEMEDGLSKTQMASIEFWSKEISTRKLHVEAIHCDITGLLAKVRRESQRGTKVVFIDHLGLIPFKIPNGMNHAKAVGSEVTNKLKRLAVELDIVIVLLSQINRAGALRGGRPRLSDLRDSGEIEQDADKVITLGREPKMSEDSTAHCRLRTDKGFDPFAADAGEFVLIDIGVEKYRNGALGDKWLKFYGSTMSYEDLHQIVQQGFTSPTTTQETLLADSEDACDPQGKLQSPKAA